MSVAISSLQSLRNDVPPAIREAQRALQPSASFATPVPTQSVAIPQAAGNVDFINYQIATAAVSTTIVNDHFSVLV